MKTITLALMGCLTLSAADRTIEQQILNELRAIRHLLESVPEDPPKPLQRTTVGSAGFSIGSPTAPITLVEFTDFQCPFCQRFQAETFGELKAKYIDTGKVRFVVRDFPLPMHGNAMQAAVAGRCAGEQSSFWPLHDWMQTHPEELAPSTLEDQAANLRLDRSRFHDCLVSGKYKDAVQRDIDEAKKAGLQGTPSFVIGKTADVIDGDVLVGALPLAAIEEHIH